MSIFAFRAGLMPDFPSPPTGAPERSDVITEEAGVRPPSGPPLRVRALVDEDQVVAQGAPVACLHDAPDIQFIAPMAGRIARISLLPGRRLSEIVLFRETGGDVEGHDTSAAATQDGLRRFMQKSGIWPMLRRRPFGGMPSAGERPAAIVVMAIDTRPHAPEPIQAIAERLEAVERGLAALTLLTEGPVFVCQPPGPRLFERGLGGGRLKSVDCGPRHPQGSPGIRIHDLAPATIEAPVWDIHAEDVAALGDLLATGILPTTRQVSVTGSAMRESRLVRTQQGADLRELTQRFVTPGAHVLLSGSPLDGQPAHWLGPRDRQVTALPRPGAQPRPHWLVSALTRSARPSPVVPTAAMRQAFGAEVPAAFLVRALSSGDDELALKLGVLSLLEEDVALADYVLGGEARLADLLRGMLDRIHRELAA